MAQEAALNKRGRLRKISNGGTSLENKAGPANRHQNQHYLKARNERRRNAEQKMATFRAERKEFERLEKRLAAEEAKRLADRKRAAEQAKAFLRRGVQSQASWPSLISTQRPSKDQKQNKKSTTGNTVVNSKADLEAFYANARKEFEKAQAQMKSQARDSNKAAEQDNDGSSADLNWASAFRPTATEVATEQSNDQTYRNAANGGTFAFNFNTANQQPPQQFAFPSSAFTPQNSKKQGLGDSMAGVKTSFDFDRWNAP